MVECWLLYAHIGIFKASQSMVQKEGHINQGQDAAVLGLGLPPARPPQLTGWTSYRFAREVCAVLMCHLALCDCI